MATVLDICTRAALNLGAVQNGEALETQELTVVQAALNALLDSESIQRNSIYRVGKSYAFNLIPGQRDYTMGVNGGTFNITTDRPDFITSITLAVSGQGTSNEEVVTLDVLEEGDWQGLPNKLYAADWPSAYHIDPAYPALTLSFYPIPTVARQITIYVAEELARTVNTGDDLVLPKGYERFLVSNLALEIQPMFPGTQLSQQLLKTAEDSRNAVRNYNRPKPPRLFSSAQLTHENNEVNDMRIRSMRHAL